MFEYDISIAIEHASFESNDIWEIEFPQSCVLYIRNHRSLPDFHEAIVKFADGQKIRYRVPIIQAKKYTVDRIAVGNSHRASSARYAGCPVSCT